MNLLQGKLQGFSSWDVVLNFYHNINLFVVNYDDDL